MKNACRNVPGSLLQMRKGYRSSHKYSLRFIETILFLPALIIFNFKYLFVKKTCLLIVLFFISACLFAQKKYWQQEANFTITVSLNDTDNSLNAFETIEYINHSPDTLDFIWFHV